SSVKAHHPVHRQLPFVPSSPASIWELGDVPSNLSFVNNHFGRLDQRFIIRETKGLRKLLTSHFFHPPLVFGLLPPLSAAVKEVFPSLVAEFSGLGLAGGANIGQYSSHGRSARSGIPVFFSWISIKS